MSHTELTEAYGLLPPRTPGFPLPAVGGADTYIQMDKVGNPNSHDNLTVLFGKSVDGKVHFEFCAFWRFEVDMAQFRKISEAVFELQAFSSGSNRKIKGGFLKPQVASPAWEDANGVGEWSLDTDMPLPMWNDGANVDNTVFHGNNFGFAIPSFNGSAVDNTVITVGEGATLLIGVTNDTAGLSGYGFVNQLQDYLDANEALRGHTKAGCIPVLFCLYLDGASLQHGIQDTRAQNFGGQFDNFLRVIHDWERINGTAELASSTKFDGAATVHDVKFGATELKTSTKIDAAGQTFARGTTELKTSTKIDAFAVVFNPLAPTKDLCVPSAVLDVPVESSTINVAVEASTLDVPVESSILKVPVESSTLDVPVEPSVLDVPVD